MRNSVTRGVALALLTLSAAGPILLLALWSVGDRWFFPSLVPPAFTAESWRALLGGGRLAGAALTSLAIALTAGIVACALALPIGRALERLTGWRRHAASAATFLPLAAPPLAVGIGLQYAFLRLGLGGTIAGVIAAHVIPATSFLALYFAGVFSAFDVRLEDEARSLGATPFQLWTRITIPVLRRQIAEAIALGCLVSWSQVALTLVIGGGLVRTLPLEVYDYMRSGEARVAATGALLLIVPSMLALAAARRERVAPL